MTVYLVIFLPKVLYIDGSGQPYTYSILCLGEILHTKGWVRIEGFGTPWCLLEM